MADVLTLVFNTLMSQTEPKEAAGSLAPADGGSVLLVGDRGASRPVLLLAAVTAAAELGLRVTVFTQSPIQSLPVPLQRCVPSLGPDSLKKVRFFYPRTVEELLRQVAGLHDSPAAPSLVVVDGLEGFLRAEPSRAARLAALLCDTAAFLARVTERRSSSSGPCRLLASFQADGEQPPAADPVLDVLHRYFQARCALEPDGGDEAAAAGALRRWQVSLPGGAEGRLLALPDGVMEFKLV